MATAIASRESAKSAPSIRDAIHGIDYRVTLRHTPFRIKSRVIAATNPDAAWEGFLQLLRAEFAGLNEVQQKVLGKQQGEWLKDLDGRQDKRPSALEVITEEEHQARRKAIEAQEYQNQLFIEQSQRAMQTLVTSQGATMEEIAKLVAGLPQTMAQAMAQAIAQVLAQQKSQKG